MKDSNWWELASDDDRRKLALRAIELAESFQSRVAVDLKALRAIRAVLFSIAREIEAARMVEAGRLAKAGMQLLDGLNGIENADFSFAEMRAMIAAEEG